MAMIESVTGATFDAATADGGLILFDLWSKGCQPCRALAPILEDLAGDFDGQVAFRKVDVSDEDALRARLALRGVPTLLLYRDGVEIDRILGVRTRSQLTAWLESRV